MLICLFLSLESFGPYLQFLHQCDKFQQQNPELFFFNISYEELKMVKLVTVSLCHLG